jgi:alpha-tubulin suppressor-like RCC1 family protein
MTFYVGDKLTNTDHLFIRKSELPTRFLYASGRGDDGQLGTGNTTAASTHVAVGGFDFWKSVDVDYYVEGLNSSGSVGIKSDGTIWEWGIDLLENTTKRSSPVRVGSKSDWVSVSLSGRSVLAIDSAGALWGRGQNSYGQLGIGTNSNVPNFVRVGNLNDWKQVFIGLGAAFAIKTDGSLWAWGINGEGVLGLGDMVSRSSPVRVGTLTDWAAISTAGVGHRADRNHAIAVKTDGSLWAWGYNSSGQLGLRDMVSRSSPVRVGTLTDWKQVSCGSECSYAVKTDGSLWAWGINNDGQLGLGNTVNRSSPVRVGALNNWKTVVAGTSSEVVCIKTDGTLWGFGRDNNNEMGGIPIEPTSSPVRVGSFSDWIDISLCDTHSLAIRAPAL